MRKPSVIQHVFQLPFNGPPVLATGSRRGNTLCSTSGDQAYLSRVLGDLDSADICTDHEAAATEILIWQATIPAIVARDMDPDIHPARYGVELAANLGIHNLAIQHHHAHAAAVCAAHALTEPVVALVLDDVALGSDGSWWGGELLWVDGDKFERLGHLMPLPMPGGDIARRESWRMASGILHRLHRPDEIHRRYAEHPASLDLVAMLNEERNCPLTTSAALLMTATAELLGLRGTGADDDGALERAAINYFSGNYATVPEQHWDITAEGNLDLYPMLAQLATEADAQRGAAIFHACLISAATEWLVRACDASGSTRVILAGCCMQQRLLAAGLGDNLTRRGLRVHEAPARAQGNASVSLGQAWIALHALRHV